MTRGPTRPAPVNQNVEPTSVKTSQDCSTTLIKRMAIVGLVQQICSIALAASDPAIRLILGAEIRYSHQFWCPRAPSPLALTCFWETADKRRRLPGRCHRTTCGQDETSGAGRSSTVVRASSSVRVYVCQSSCCRGRMPAHARPRACAGRRLRPAACIYICTRTRARARGIRMLTGPPRER